jgi:hypothetical protein
MKRRWKVTAWWVYASRHDVAVLRVQTAQKELFLSLSSLKDCKEMGIDLLEFAAQERIRRRRDAKEERPRPKIKVGPTLRRRMAS